MILIAGLAYLMSQQEGGLATTIPVLGALALGAQRLVPALQQAYGASTQIKGARSSLEDVLSLLDQPLPSYSDQPYPIQIPFEKAIHLKKLSFRYAKDEPWVLKNIDLKLTKGSRIGFMGLTGSGKSTLFDIIMGLLSPTDGEFTTFRQLNHLITSFQCGQSMGDNQYRQLSSQTINCFHYSLLCFIIKCTGSLIKD